MLDVHRKYERLINDTFKNDPLFLSALDKACASVINKRLNDKQPCRSAELVNLNIFINFLVFIYISIIIFIFIFSQIFLMLGG